MQLLAKTFKGLEDVLAQELTELGANDIQKERRAVSFTGDKAMLYRANLCLRTASRVLVPIATFRAKDADAVYEQAKSIDWSEYMTAKTTFAIDATVYSETFRHSKYVTYRVKDAIADYWMARENQRPSVKVTDPDLSLNVHIANETVTISLDSSGESLHKRGYRPQSNLAPLRETLAAALVTFSRPRSDVIFVDPMCGSGTIAIEAALIDRHIAPGINRGFAAEEFTFLDRRIFDDAREKARSLIVPAQRRIFGSDIDPACVSLSETNARRAGVDGDIVFTCADARMFRSPIEGAKGTIVCNPPYGERMGDRESASILVRDVGKTLAENVPSWQLYFISDNMEFERDFGRRADKKRPLYNGMLKCALYQYFRPEFKKD